ncbi:unnamed protein product, partial [Didymodactylos carnosus]|jgi:hypothetical protein
MAAR